jgi:putative addiction module component (TIGR02574 family)
MSVPEKLLLVEDIWNSIAVQESKVPVPQSHIEELERRLENLNPESLLSLDELRAWIKSRTRPNGLNGSFEK